MIKFETAAQVRAHLKAAGVDPKGMKIRWMASPFGGDGRFWIEVPAQPEDGMRFTVAAPGQPLQYSDARRTELAKLVANTNARIK